MYIYLLFFEQIDRQRRFAHHQYVLKDIHHQRHQRTHVIGELRSEFPLSIQVRFLFTLSQFASSLVSQPPTVNLLHSLSSYYTQVIYVPYYLPYYSSQNTRITSPPPRDLLSHPYSTKYQNNPYSPQNNYLNPHLTFIPSSPPYNSF